MHHEALQISPSTKLNLFYLSQPSTPFKLTLPSQFLFQDKTHLNFIDTLMSPSTVLSIVY